jgi:hypothetical protein
MPIGALMLPPSPKTCLSWLPRALVRQSNNTTSSRGESP